MLAIASGARRTREAEDVKPVVIYEDHRFRHKTLSAPGKSEPASAVVPFIAMKTAHTNVLFWRFLQSNSPVPLFSAFDRR